MIVDLVGVVAEVVEDARRACWPAEAEVATNATAKANVSMRFISGILCELHPVGNAKFRSNHGLDSAAANGWRNFAAE